MGEVKEIKTNIAGQLKGLCAHCSSGNTHFHNCPVQEILVRVESLHGVPLVVNSEFKGLLWV